MNTQKMLKVNKLETCKSYSSIPPHCYNNYLIRHRQTSRQIDSRQRLCHTLALVTFHSTTFSFIIAFSRLYIKNLNPCLSTKKGMLWNYCITKIFKIIFYSVNSLRTAVFYDHFRCMTMVCWFHKLWKGFLLNREGWI